MSAKQEIATAEALAVADFETIELAHVKLRHPERGHREQGRIVGRFNDDITLLYRGHEATVPNVREWTLREYTPVTSTVQRQLVADELDGYDGGER